MKKLAIGVVALVLCAGAYYLSVRPKVDSALVGLWQGTITGMEFEFRGDGSYTMKTYDDFRRRKLLSTQIGHWTATKKHVYFRPDAEKPWEWPIAWNDEKTWQNSETGIGHWKKVK